MKCQLKYRWVKLPRACLPQGKGVLGQWARLAARAAYRKGVGLYCGFEKPCGARHVGRGRGRSEKHFRDKEP